VKTGSRGNVLVGEAFRTPVEVQEIRITATVRAAVARRRDAQRREPGGGGALFGW